MSPKIDYLLAKSYSARNGQEPPTYARLLPHLRAVERAGEVVVEVAGELILKQLDLPTDPWLSRLRRAVTTGCLFHDIGKANDGFQKMVRRAILPTQQPARHELLSALLLANDGAVRDLAFKLLSDGDIGDATTLLDCVIGAVGGHHVKLDEEWKKASIALREGGCGTGLRILLTHSDLGSLFSEAMTTELKFDLTGNKSNYLGELQLPFRFSSNRWRDRLKQEPEWWRFAAAVKALVMAADLAGSAILPEKEVDIRHWITAALSQRITAEEMRDVVRARLLGNRPRPFQTAVESSEGRVTLVEAGCGTGKTAAAYLWAAKQAQDKKLFFCYPTTGTATEGFLGYVAETDVEAELMHSRAIVDLEGIAEARSDLDTDDHLLRIESLRAWDPKVVICTADTVLALVRNNRRGLYNSPAILSASLVFDELHAYEDRMFVAVIALIKALPGASFLLMTASLPHERKQFLLSELNAVEQVPSPKDLEELPRYQFEEPIDLAQAELIVERAIANELRVLWVCNTVSRAQDIFARLREKRLPTLTYHSRFKYEDRRDRHREVVDAFGCKEHSEGIVAVTTQVAEMSLDLDADILITEIAPVPSLIQRLGRLNRHITPEAPGQPRRAYFIEPEREVPYDPAELDLGRKWIEALRALVRPLRQTDLAETFNVMRPNKELHLDLRTEWLDSGYFAFPGPVREAGISVSVILPEDEDLCRRERKELIKKAIPMNYRGGMEHWPELKGNLIAPPNTIEYSEEVGARWLKR